jgi:hypothetical protein
LRSAPLAGFAVAIADTASVPAVRSVFAMWLTVLVGLSVLIGADPVRAQGETTSDAARELAERHAPIVMLREQSAPCDVEGEAFAPMAVDVVLDNDDVLLRQAGTGDPVVRRAPTAADLFGRGDGFFLDFNGLALEPGCVYEKDFDSYTAGTDPVVYAHVVQQPDEPGYVAVQYWLYWYYNDWNNTHESDWEFIQLLFEASTVEEALASEPIEVGYAQHEGGERADWDSDKLEREGARPVVYSSAGSHASYFDSSVFLGRSGSEGFGCDTTIGPSVRTDPGVVLLPTTVDDADDEFAWLAFTGRWGERQRGAFNGPTGPNTKPQWEAPVDWYRELRGASVAIPGSDDGSTTILDTFCSVVEIGADQLRAAQQSPTMTVVVLVLAAAAVRLLARRTDWSSVPAVPLWRRRRTGQMIRGAFASYWTSRGAIGGIAILYVPAAIVVGVVGRTTSFNTGQAVSGVLTSVMLILAIATISAFWHLASSVRDQPFLDAVHLVRRRLPSVVFTMVRATVIVVGLALTVIGLPWSIRQAVRYQFAVSVVVTEELSGADALARSTELVRGRWWRTAFTLGLFGVLAFLVNSVLQLGLLVVLGSLPLWLYLSISFVATGLVVPLVATPAILLYGDAAAEHRDGGGEDVTSERDDAVPSPV